MHSAVRMLADPRDKRRVKVRATSDATFLEITSEEVRRLPGVANVSLVEERPHVYIGFDVTAESPCQRRRVVDGLGRLLSDSTPLLVT